METPSSLLVPVEHRVDVFVAHGLRSIDLGTTGDLLGAPALLEFPDDPASGFGLLSAALLIGFSESLVASGLGVPGAPVNRGFLKLSSIAGTHGTQELLEFII